MKKILTNFILACLVICLGYGKLPNPFQKPTLNHPPCFTAGDSTTLMVAYDSRFSPEEVQIMERALTEYTHVGITFRTVARNENLHVSVWRNSTGNHRIGEYAIGTNEVWVDTMRITDSNSKTGMTYLLGSIVIHETGHWLGMQHVCSYPNEDEVCSPVGLGIARMNPLLWNADRPALNHLDILEFNRTSRCH